MELKDINICLYERKEAIHNKVENLDSYVSMVRFGANQDAVIAGRKAKQEGNKELYSKIKNESRALTPTGIFESGKTKEKKNLKPNGIVCIDIDVELTKEQEHSLYNDKYTFIMHKSFGGDGYCIFIKIDPSKIDDAYDAVSKYYLDEYEVKTDQACKNSNRLRFMSYDPDIHINNSASKFNVKVEKKDRKPTVVDYIFTQSDFDQIMSQINDKGIDLVKGDYFRYMRIGFALYSEFGEIKGREYFDIVNNYNSRHKKAQADSEWKGFCRDGDIKIGTFYYYCKEEGINVYSEKTKAIINRVKVSKSQGTPTIDAIVSNLEIANNIQADEEDRLLIKKLIDSKTDFSKLANQDVTEIEQLSNFIVDVFEPTKDEITHAKYVNGKIYEDEDFSNIYLSCVKNLDFKVNSSDVRFILNSNYVRKTNVLKDFINENADLKPEGYIDQYASFIHPQTEYNKWAFKKWIVGSMHNWFAEYDDSEACPLTLVLTGSKHGAGKSSFFRNLMPKKLRKYLVESKLSIKNKDSMFRMCKTLMIVDPEFGGKAFKDDKEFKDISDKTHYSDRLSYGHEDVNLRRRCGLGACSNEIDVLKDVTGNRRILPVMVHKTDYESIVKFDKTMLIMEAYNLYKSGFEWRIFSDEDIQYIYDNTTQNQTILPVEELFFNHFSLERGGDYLIEVVMNQSEILEHLLRNSLMKPTKFDIKDVFIKNKLEYTNHKFKGVQKKGVKLYMIGSEPAPF